MRKIFVILVLALLVIPKPAFAQNTQNFNIQNFDADYYLTQESDRSSTLKVQETIVANFPNYDQNHGILRAIPETYQDRSLRLGDISVKDQNSKNYNYTTSEENDNKVLKIGDADKYVHGLATYKISYTVHDVTGHYNNDARDVLFWDINGDQWSQEFDEVTARFHIPKSLEGFLADNKACNTGVFGSTAKDCTVETATSGNEILVTSKTTKPLNPSETLSVAMVFQPGLFPKSLALQKQERNLKIEKIVAICVGVAIPLGALMFMFRRWRAFGNDPKGRGVIIPEYEPPKGFDVLHSDFMFSQKLSSKAISAFLIDLAVKGFITIYEVPKKGIFGSKDYRLKLNSVPTSASKEVMDALSIIFVQPSAGDEVKLSDLKKNTSVQSQVYKSMKKLEDNLSASLHILGYFIKDPKKVKNGYLIRAILLIFVPTFFAGVLSLNQPILLGIWGGVIAAGAVVFLFSFIMPARTEAGVAVYDALLGLKDYIKLAEADRLKFLQSPEGAEKITDKEAFDPKNPEAKVKLFEKLLPYAILFGLEKDWAKQFADIYTTAPGWYQGNWTAFNIGYLAGSIGDFNNATGASFASPSSGGGGAGGGGGGGGGGGW